MRCFSFSDSLSMIISRSICISANGMISFFLMAESLFFFIWVTVIEFRVHHTCRMISFFLN